MVVKEDGEGVGDPPTQEGVAGRLDEGEGGH